MALFQRGVRHNRTPIMEEVMRHFRSRYSQADIERIRRERESDFRRWVIDYIGGQIHFIQHLRGAESVQVLGEIEAVDFNATHCIVRVANLRQRNRDRLESWRTLPWKEVALEIRFVSRLEHRWGHLGFEYADMDSPLRLDSCRVVLRPKGDSAISPA